MKRAPAWGVILVSAALSLGGPGPATATDAPSEPPRDLRELSLEELMQIEVPTVVGASKREQKITDAPSAVTVVMADEIRKFGHRSLADILRSVRGLYVGYDRTYGYIGVRGFNSPGDFGGRILLSINGHRLNEPLFDSAFNGTDFLLDVDLIERVEIVRGPGSVLYGNNAFFAVVNVVTRNAASVDGGEVAGAAGSHDTYQGRATIGKVLASGVEVLLAGTSYHSHGKGHIEVPGFDTPARNPGVATNFDADEFWSTFGSVRYRGVTLEGGYIRRQKDTPLAPYGSLFDVDRQHPIDSRGYASLGWAGSLARDWSSSVRAYYDYYGLEVDYPYGSNDPGEPAPVSLNRERDRAQWVGVEGQASRVFFGKHRLTLGAEGRYDFDLRIRSWDDPPFSLVSNLDTTTHREGMFTQGELALLPTLTFVAGGRYDHYSEFGDTFNPRVALVYRPLESASLKFLYGHAYRAPNVFERDFVGIGSVANPDLKPERIRTYELVYEHYLPQDIRVSVSGFLPPAIS